MPPASKISTAAQRYSYTSVKIPWRQKFYELSTQFQMLLSTAVKGESFDGLFSEIEEYRQLLDFYCSKPLDAATVFEIGFGQRPDRLMAFISFGINAQGVDIETPLLRGTPSEVLAMLRTNGCERTLKSLLRYVLFDLQHRRRLKHELAKRGGSHILDSNRFLTCDAARLLLPEHSLDLIVSHDVFEHIDIGSIPALIGRLACWLKPDGLALITPNVFTGIQGGHLTDWFSLDQTKKRRAEPWEHLRKRRFEANAYLNELSLARYRELFSAYFEILEERVKQPNLGIEFFSASVAEELKAYSAEELFSNQVLFVLKALPSGE